jgi:N-glycosylase/DNA lyase
VINFSEDEITKAKNIVSRFKKEKSKIDVFYNLCFCILVPQTKFKTVSKVIENLKQSCFFSNYLSRETVLFLISSIRFKNKKVDYLLKLKYSFDVLYKNLDKILKSDCDSKIKRIFVVKNIKGIGLKAASHFLRNMGIEDLAIIDSHIIKFLGITKKFNYLKIENDLKEQAKKYKISLAVYDALIWKQMSKTEEQNFIY